jgi:uroporphyrinogen decarboxylase
MIGLKELLLYMYKKPSFVKDVLKKNYEFSLEIGKAYLDAGAEIILIGDDIADKHGPFMTPKLYEEFVYPYSKSLVQALKKRGAKVILHTDGYIMPIIDYILDLGIDALHPLEPTAGMNIAEFKQKYGDTIAVVGGVDVATLLPFGSEEDVEKSIIEVIKKVSPGGGHILASTNSLHSYVPDINKFIRNIIRYVETAHKFGVYPIK